MSADEIRRKHNQNIRTAADMLRVARKLPSDQDIDRVEAIKLVTGGEDIQTLLDEIERLEKALTLISENYSKRGLIKRVCAQALKESRDGSGFDSPSTPTRGLNDASLA